MKELFIRIGSMDYEPSATVKPHTLDQRLIDTLNFQQLYDNTSRLSHADTCLTLIKSGTLLNLEIAEHRLPMQAIINQNLKKLKDWTRKSGSTLIDQRRSIVQIREKIVQQGQKIKRSIQENTLAPGGDRRYQENSLIHRAKIVLTTLSMSGTERLEIAKDKFEYLIIDEACQCIEPSTLIPFSLNPHRVIMVGDQKQLPATTFSENAEETKFSRSFFERLLDNGYSRFMLSIQYRMHPAIRAYPSRTFYENRIQDDYSISQRKLDPFLLKVSNAFEPLIFFD